MIITIDGPCASGKSSLAHALAKKHGYHHLQTGLFYRAAAYIFLSRHPEIDPTDLEQLTERCKQIGADDLAAIDSLEYRCDNDQASVWFNGIDITDQLHLVSIGQPASIISTHKLVRDRLLHAQQVVGHCYNIVADGRDCGSIVFPDAEHKFYITARQDVRADRMLADPERKAQGMTHEQALHEVIMRDERDMTRAVAPLTVPQGATIIDNSDLNFDQTLARLEQCLN